MHINNPSPAMKNASVAAMSAVILVALCACDLRGQATTQAPQESSLDHAVRDLDAASPRAAQEADVPSSGLGHTHESAHSDSHPAAAPPSQKTPVDQAEGGAVASFCASWRLFHNSYLVGWLVGLVLSLVGVIVVARDQVFIGAAVSQASTLGIALALCCSSVFPLHHDESSLLPHSELWFCCDSFQVTMAVAFSVLAALITSWADHAKYESHEAITGWVFLISASLSVLAVAHSPHGLEEIRRIHSSSIIGATATDAWVFAGLLAITILLLLLAGRRLLLFIIDPAMASAVGMRVGRWAVVESLWLGLVVGLSIRVSGMLFTFGSLVLPALVAKNVCREVRSMFFVAPVVALITNTLGFVLANRYDFPPAQMNVAVLCLLLVIAWAVRRVRRV